MGLQKELNEVKTDLESVRCQLETMAIRAVNQKSVSDAEKREKLIVIKKLEGLEKELKLLAYSESLTDQTLDQLRLENNRLREENLALLRVMDKIVKNSLLSLLYTTVGSICPPLLQSSFYCENLLY